MFTLHMLNIYRLSRNKVFQTYILALAIVLHWLRLESEQKSLFAGNVYFRAVLATFDAENENNLTDTHRQRHNREN